MMHHRSGTSIRAAAALLAALALSGCTATQSDSYSAVDSTSVQSTTATAPADLQLSCSTAAASQFGLPPDNVLPTSSAQLPDGSYDVTLLSDGNSYMCRIDENANILSLNPA